MNAYGDLQTMLQQAESISKPSIRQSVLIHTERIRKNYELICLTGEAALPFGVDALCWEDPNLTTTQVLQRIGVK